MRKRMLLGLSGSTPRGDCSGSLVLEECLCHHYTQDCVRPRGVGMFTLHGWSCEAALSAHAELSGPGCSGLGCLEESNLAFALTLRDQK